MGRILTGRPRVVCWWAIVAFLPLCGCSQEPRQYVVTGSVSYRGQLVTEGEIIFVAGAGSGESSVGRIEQGRYMLRTSAGDKQVRITASKETGRMLEGGMGARIPERIDLIPPKYNTDTTLSCTVDPQKLALDFDLK